MKNKFTKLYIDLINNDAGLTLPVVAYYSYLADKYDTFQRLQGVDEIFVARSTIKKELGLSNNCSRKYEEILLKNKLIEGKYRTSQGRTHLYFKVAAPILRYEAPDRNDEAPILRHTAPDRVDTEPNLRMMQTSIRQTTLGRKHDVDVLTPEHISIIQSAESFKIARKHISGLKPQTYNHYKSQVNYV